MTLPKDPIKKEEYLKRLRKINVGRIPWNKGRVGIYSNESLAKMRNKIISKETKLKISQSKKGQKSSFKGKHHMKYSIDLIRNSKLGKPNKLTAWGLQKKISVCKNRIWSVHSRNKIRLNKLGKPRPQHVKDALLRASIGRIISEETRLKMSKANIGKRWTEESKQKLRDKRKNWVIPFKDTKPEIMMQISLNLNGIKFEKHKPFKLGKSWHQVDLFIEPNICVEIDGAHWHIKSKDMKRDLFQSQELNLMGYHVIRIREKDILKNAQVPSQNIINLIKDLQNRNPLRL